QDAVGVEVPVLRGVHPRTDPIRAVNEWRSVLASRGIYSGHLLRSVERGADSGRDGAIGQRMHPSSVNAAVRKRAELAELPDAEKYTAHSLRAGAATIAYMNGAPV